jgi:hypothetical protein
MAGAGGVFVMFIGALIGLASGGLALVLALSEIRVTWPRLGRASSILAVSGSVLATLMMLPAWGVIVSGTGTRGDKVELGELPLWVYLLLATPIVTLGSFVLRWKAERRARGITSG